ncbi:MAG: T9SS type A sorting domain-containing protein [Saprospiraceae bacterium]|nr:T9SS type A sorting domain-containing protein [Saprospiraceae bacterium]
MKFKITFVLILIFGCLHNIDAQRNNCATIQDEAFIQRLEANVKNVYNGTLKSKVARFIPVQIHIVADNDGSNTITQDEIISKMCILNDRYLDTEMHFYLAGINEIFNTRLNHQPGIGSSISVIRNAKNDDAMNIFLVNEILDENMNRTGAGGYYSGGSSNDFIIMLQSTPGNDGYTMEHEIGHFFSLSHTHYGWEGDLSGNPNHTTPEGYDPDFYGDTVTIQIVTGSTQAPDVLVELVDGSNCTTAGDRICDTPPDYGFGQACSCCTMQWDVWDRNGDKIEPMMDNVMSYSDGCNPYRFSPDQISTMQTDFESPFRRYLRTNEVFEYTPITSEVDIIAPQNFDVYDNFDGVLIEWMPVENAEYYKVYISGAQSLAYETSDTELYIQDLMPSAPYFVDVRAFNKFGTGCQTSTRRLFDTGPGSTAVNETEHINDVHIYPNPVAQYRDLKINLNASKQLSASLKLHDINGKLIEKINTTFAVGKNEAIIPSTVLNTGIYILEIETQEGIITEKIIVE